MSNKLMTGKRVLVTQSEAYMGGAMVNGFENEGAHVIANNSDLRQDGVCEALVTEAGHIDILVANMAPLKGTVFPAHEIENDMFKYMFEMMVYPLHRLCRSVLPQMYERKRGKIVVIGSITGLRAEKTNGVMASAYTAARSAQTGYVRAVGAEAARNNVQINLIAQHFTYSPTFFPDEMQQTPEFKTWLSDCPAGRLATGQEDADLALFLASNKSDFINGTSIPFTGGWHL
jgi:NAD(P)-dependent dehydrogenase (short-subunit alcohol dehydrogenase family)